MGNASEVVFPMGGLSKNKGEGVWVGRRQIAESL
jgi:hypothetical protein